MREGRERDGWTDGRWVGVGLVVSELTMYLDRTRSGTYAGTTTYYY